MYLGYKMVYTANIVEPHSCISFKQFVLGFLVLVNYPCLLSSDYFEIDYCVRFTQITYFNKK